MLKDVLFAIFVLEGCRKAVVFSLVLLYNFIALGPKIDSLFLSLD